MIGGIFGDLAGATYQKDKALFYKELFTEDAPISRYGLTILAAAKFLYEIDGLKINVDNVRERLHANWNSIISKGLKRGFHIPEALQHYESQTSQVFCPEYSAIYLLRLAVEGWFVEPGDKPNNLAWYVIHDMHGDKEEGYAKMVMPQVIACLRSGYSKDETWQRLNEVFRSLRHTWDWRNGESTLCLLLRAWNCFYHSFDYGSAIHNAVRDYPKDPALMASIVGMIADAMYGHGYYYIKQKFAGTDAPYNHLTIPKIIKETFEDELHLIHIQEKWTRVFFPKNDALTNVEIQQFKHYQSRYENFQISAETRRRIHVAFETGWEDRFGFYLDNGWIYLYRSHFVLGRFQIVPNGNDYRIRNIQITASNPSENLDVQFESALHSANTAVLQAFQYYSFYWSTPKHKINPFKDKDEIKFRFWEGERMFYETQRDRWNEWIDESQNALTSISDKRWIDHAKRLGRESFAILYYINCQYARFCSMDNLDWLLQY